MTLFVKLNPWVHIGLRTPTTPQVLDSILKSSDRAYLSTVHLTIHPPTPAMLPFCVSKTGIQHFGILHARYQPPHSLPIVGHSQARLSKALSASALR